MQAKHSRRLFVVICWQSPLVIGYHGNMTDNKQGSLSAEQKEKYWENGYLFPIDVFDPEEALSYRAELEEIEQKWLDADLPRALNQYRRVSSHVVIPLAAKMASDPRILDAVESILGPNLLIWSAEFFIKEPKSPQIVGMHQDLTYWGMGETPDQVTAWVALSPATKESGCMDFVGGSHKNPILPHNDTFSENNMLSRGQEIAVEVSEDDKTAITLKPGQMSLHHGLTIHGSGPNGSNDRRIGFAIRYLNPKVRQQVADKEYAMLARGEEVSGNFELVPPPSKLFDPASLALYEEIRQAQSKALAKGARQNISY